VAGKLDMAERLLMLDTMVLVTVMDEAGDQMGGLEVVSLATTEGSLT
jgi:hypothetical protein